MASRSSYLDNDIEVDEIDGVIFTSFLSAEQLGIFVAKKLSSRLAIDSLCCIEQEELLPSICPPIARLQVGDRSLASLSV